jgi:hypothetical protein
MSTIKSAELTTKLMPEQQTQSAHLLLVAITVLGQAVDLVENVLTSDEQLCIVSKFLPGSTIGMASASVSDKTNPSYVRQASISDMPETTSPFSSIVFPRRRRTYCLTTHGSAIHLWKHA